MRASLRAECRMLDRRQRKEQEMAKTCENKQRPTAHTSDAKKGAHTQKRTHKQTNEQNLARRRTASQRTRDTRFDIDTNLHDNDRRTR